MFFTERKSVPECLLLADPVFLQGALVFVTALTAILCFGALTQGWMLTKLRIYERLLLIPVIICLFRPDYVMNKIYSPFDPIDVGTFVAGTAAVEPDQTVRFHIVRESPYGDRFKLYALNTPEPAADQIMGPYGMGLIATADGRYAVETIAFGGAADAIGITFGDIVTGMDVEVLGQPPKELVYPFGFVLLGLIILLQRPRVRREEADEEARLKADAEQVGAGSATDGA